MAFRTLAAAACFASLSLPATASDISPELSELNQTLLNLGTSSQAIPTFKQGASVSVHGAQVLLQGTGKDGKPATYIFEFSAAPLVGPNNGQVMLSPVETTLHVYKMGADGVPTLAPIPGNAPGTAAAPQSDTGKASPQAAVLVQQISPPSACAGAPSEPRLAVGDEYNYGVVWCPNSTSATKSAKKNYHYMFASGSQVLVLTMDFNCATDTAFMPPAVVTYCQS